MSAEQRKPRKRSLIQRLFCCVSPEVDNGSTTAHKTSQAGPPKNEANATTTTDVPVSSTNTKESSQRLSSLNEKIDNSNVNTASQDRTPAQPIQETGAATSDTPIVATSSPFLSGLQPALEHESAQAAGAGQVKFEGEASNASVAEVAALVDDHPLTPSSGVISATIPIETTSVSTVPQSETPEVQATAWLLPPLSADLSGKKCLVLDLDETLVHSSFKVIHQADFVVPVEIDGIYHNVYVIKRPGVDDFMLEVGRHFEIVVFTASLSKYADPVLDILDVHKVVHHRLFRESCHNHMGNYVKDLSQLGRDLKDSIIIDNSPASYVFHPAHAVPISSWFNDVHDTELIDLIPFLVDLTTVEDVAQVLDLSL
ncbi:Putative uncharacterized protein [Taphrina deformans PYCC 5710]|uniref:FCP1 homology domain-containing protein n=1 Tax=Taphrina deformans (strain PYCC 5710 / ATCC 11124 / CBS 356.35 / IMI 108563 / JCM 9778 / NBRC 8474) TaxID=1097556 RepID=R4XCS5_TAPDE|nr:Putative uncharacterized protein [Taphrina deformans PYCC 5710]|eukprot:CCG83423.1 Putative uncharacterized protein [Taphrina deformans PYCC 5710]